MLQTKGSVHSDVEAQVPAESLVLQQTAPFVHAAQQDSLELLVLRLQLVPTQSLQCDSWDRDGAETGSGHMAALAGLACSQTILGLPEQIH